MTQEYTQGICDGGGAILCDGVMMTIDEVVAKLNELEGDNASLKRIDAERFKIQSLQQSEILKLNKQVRELEADKRRLDWLDENRQCDWPFVEVYVDAYGVNFEYWGNKGRGQAFEFVREAIDNAKEE